MNLLFWVITCDYTHTDLYYHIQNEERQISYMKNQICPLEKKRERESKSYTLRKGNDV